MYVTNTPMATDVTPMLIIAIIDGITAADTLTPAWDNHCVTSIGIIYLYTN